MKLMLLSLVLLLVRDDGRYVASPLKPWFEGLRNGWGQSCCDLADGVEVVDGDWDTYDGHYASTWPGAACNCGSYELGGSNVNASASDFCRRIVAYRHKLSFVGATESYELFRYQCRPRQWW
jgi:hypothetical protein